jgi:hypothetical protein
MRVRDQGHLIAQGLGPLAGASMHISVCMPAMIKRRIRRAFSSLWRFVSWKESGVIFRWPLDAATTLSYIS